MLFSITWKMFDNTKLDCYRAFMAMTPADDVADAGEGVTIVGRWHAVGSGSGVLIAETDDAAALTSFMVNWAGLCDITITPVTDDVTTRAVLNAKLAAPAASTEETSAQTTTT
jgi:hypothetical protein